MGLRCFAFLTPLPLAYRTSHPSPREPRLVRLPHRTVVAGLQLSAEATGSDILPSNQYVPLHVHSDFSLLDGASQLPSLVARAAELDVPALALTDHGVLYGAVQLVRACADTEVKPIIGNEMYVVNDVPNGQPNGKGPKRYHLIVLAKNDVGYRNLVKLTTLAHLEGVVGKGIFARPCINKAQLYQYREGLIVSSACLGGEIAQAILNDDVDSARAVASWFHDVFGDDFYLEIQDHGSEEDKKVNPVMIQLSKELSIKVIATNDSHFTNCLDAEAHDALICIQTGKRLSDENRLRYSGTEYFKSIDEMRQCFVDHLPRDAVDEALCNTLRVAEKVEPYNLFGATRIPDFPIPNNFGSSHDDYLRHVAQLGLQERLKARIKSSLISKGSERTYIERLDLELDMIRRMGFSSYFLVVWDYICFARTNNIPVGPGRGSAAGSLVAFALRITDVDPIPFNLLFERFLNIERKSMPDIDTDFSVDGREKVIAYVTERYSQSRVAQIITFNRLTSKAVLKDVARVHNVSYKEADRLAKLIPVSRGKPATLKDLLSKKPSSKDFKTAVEGHPEYREWLDKAQRIEGTNKTFGIHAAGVVISANPLTDIVPLTKAKHGETITQYAMEDVESVGLLKMDFLGLKSLTVIERALEFIRQGRHEQGNDENLEFSVDALPLDDEKTYKLLSEGELDGIFQLDASSGMRNIVRELRPTSLEDISSILALYRPGPLDAGLIPKFIRRKHGLDPIEYDHPLLEPILKETYGIMVYQEQIMRIARDLAGYSLGQADILRRAMGKKKLKDMEKERPRFVKGAEERGISNGVSEKLFDMMVKFAEYCFNKSHSTAYAYLTYQTAFLKANYPVEYSAAILTSNMQQSEKLVRYLADARMLGVCILPPSVNSSGLGFTVHRQRGASVVRFGFEAVKTVGSSVSQALIDERNLRGPYRSIVDLINRVDLRVLNKRAIAALIQAGAFDELHPNRRIRRILLDKFDNMLSLRRKLRDKRKRWENKNAPSKDMEELSELERTSWEESEIELARASEDEPDFTDLERLSGEKSSIGFYASGHPLENLQEVAKFLGCTRVDLIVGEGADATSELEGSEILETVASALPNDADVMILSCVTELKKVTTAKGRKMARWMIEDSTSRVGAVVFPGQYEVVEQTLRRSYDGLEYQSEEADAQYVVQEDARVIVWGKIDTESSGTAQVVVDDVQRIEDVRVVVVTARYTPTRSKSESLEVLRNIVKDVLGEGYRGQDSNGTYAKRRRWIKSKPLHEKNRVPVLLRFLDEEGNTVSTTHVGNDFRFPSNSEALIAELQRRAGVECVEISVWDTLADINGSFMLSFDDVDDQNTTTGDAYEAECSARGAATHSVRETFEGIIVEDCSRLSNESSSLKTNHKPGDRSQEEGLNTNADKVRERLSTALPTAIEVHRSTGTVDAQRESVVKTRFNEDEHRDLSFNEGDDFAWSTSKRAEVINSMKWMPKRDIFSEKVFCAGPRMNDFAPSDAFLRYSEEAKPSLLTASRADEHVRARLEKNLHSTTLDSQVESFSGHQPKIESECFKIGSEDPPENHKLSEAEKKTESHSSCGDIVQSDTFIDSIDETLLSKTSKESSESLLSRYRGLDLKDGMLLDFDSLGFEGLLDAVCLLGGEAARLHTQCECVVAGITGISTSKIVEKNVMLKLKGKPSYVKDKCIYVLIDVREVEPTGGRKRGRSFGPIVVLLISRNKQAPMKTSTKQTQKLIGSTSKCLEKAATIDFDFSRRERKRQYTPQQYLDRSTELQLATDIDGSYETHADCGQILSSMFRIALLCVGRAFEVADEKLHVVSVDSITVSNPAILHGTIVHQSVNAIIFDISLKQVNVQVKSVLSTANGATVQVTAGFMVAHKERHNKFPNVRANDEPLYQHREISECFHGYSRGLRRNGEV
ncbi:DNA-directed DNA polymerase [Gracilaria domingensis]|nr:DNA-directed DNA polymerase [Gracilaria domingensis]